MNNIPNKSNVYIATSYIYDMTRIKSKHGVIRVLAKFSLIELFNKYFTTNQWIKT